MKDSTPYALKIHSISKNTPGISPVVHIYYCIQEERLSETRFYYFLQQLPPPIQHKILRFHKWEDRQRSLLGKLLLKRGLNETHLTAHSLANLKYTEFLRPYFDELIDFNISHSGRYTVCAISKVKVGIDVEEILPIPFDGFESQFSAEEWKHMQQAKDSLRAFYTLWTQKESFVKAWGTGLHLSLNEVAVQHNKIAWNHEVWHVHEINLDQRHICSLCMRSAAPELQLQRVNFS